MRARALGLAPLVVAALSGCGSSTPPPRTPTPSGPSLPPLCQFEQLPTPSATATPSPAPCISGPVRVVSPTLPSFPGRTAPPGFSPTPHPTPLP